MKESKKETNLIFNVNDIGKARKKLTQANNSVDGVEANHIVAFLTPKERINFFNELYRVMKKDSKCQVVTPNWSSNRAYADLRMQYPPVSEGWFFNLDANFRKQDPNGDKRYRCDFASTWGYSLHPLLQARNQEYQQHAITFWKESAQDIIATLVKK